MPKLKNSNATFLVIFKHCDNLVTQQCSSHSMAQKNSLFKQAGSSQKQVQYPRRTIVKLAFFDEVIEDMQALYLPFVHKQVCLLCLASYFHPPFCCRKKMSAYFAKEIVSFEYLRQNRRGKSCNFIMLDGVRYSVTTKNHRYQ